MYSLQMFAIYVPGMTSFTHINLNYPSICLLLFFAIHSTSSVNFLSSQNMFNVIYMQVAYCRRIGGRDMQDMIRNVLKRYVWSLNKC